MKKLVWQQPKLRYKHKETWRYTEHDIKHIVWITAEEWGRTEYMSCGDKEMEAELKQGASVSGRGRSWSAETDRGKVLWENETITQDDKRGPETKHRNKI